MKDDRANQLRALAAGLGPSFWDEVEYEIEQIDWLDFAEFLEADALPSEVRAEFREELRSTLQAFIRSRYSS